MTRAEYRRTQRDKQKTYTLTKADLDRIRKEEYARASKELEKIIGQRSKKSSR